MASSLSSLRESVERHVQPQDVHMWLADQAEQATFGVSLDEAAQLGFIQAARLGDARYLE
jgi:hypothetical protein